MSAKIMFFVVFLVALFAYLVHLDKQTMDLPTYLMCKALRIILPITFPKDIAEARYWRGKLDKYIRKGQFFKFKGDTIEVELKAEDGTALPARIYMPVKQNPVITKRPVLVWIHGGGWVIGNIDVDGGLAAHLGSEADMVTMIITYRMAPEHPYPTAVTDCRLALEWISGNIHKYGGDAEEIYLAGESAGGNLAAVLTSLNLDPNLIPEGYRIPIKGLLLAAPSVASFGTYPSVMLYGKGGLLTAYQLEAFRAVYANQNDSAREEYAFAPIHTPKELLAQYPPTIFILAQYDPLLDEGLHFAQILQSLGVNVLVKLYETSTHAFFGTDLLPHGSSSVSFAAKELRKIARKANKE